MTDERFRDDDAVQTAVRNLFIGSAPERRADLAAIWQELEPKFQIAPDLCGGDRIIMDAGAYRYVRFNNRVLRAFWIAAYAAWEGYRTVAEAPALDDLDLGRFNNLVSPFESVIASNEPNLEPLPSGVAEPGHYPPKNLDPQGRATAELATIAVAWALLHEVRHIRHQREGTGANPRGDDAVAKHQEEFSCDEFATTFLLESIDTYTQQTGEAAALVQQKRQLGIYFGLFALTMLAKDKWRASATHPDVQTRIDRVRARMSTEKSELAAAMAHAAFAVLGMVWRGAPNPY
jgi:hypothetical protein